MGALHDFEDETRAIGITVFLPKPLTSDILIDLVSRLDAFAWSYELLAPREQTLFRPSHSAGSEHVEEDDFIDTRGHDAHQLGIVIGDEDVGVGQHRHLISATPAVRWRAAFP